ncbi:AglZ/HisF2 family acetamidino modification protein [Aliarcobacter lanthieri]|uniref:AglZ/HisF2 family acetamidino modification protein n=1 Tax=Aliarcobacter lanthieri TaxID=1355374 RepID=UPI00047B363B|nr:AglZ/HisF2 family acetamidino modification protein [Aliarcobacter lanthieri]QKF58965.1 glycosyl amidation-associated protein WbuZ [Aliarcobacter lanthieri]
MLKTRVIPILLMKNGGLYKGIQFKKHKYVGDPINTVKIFNDKEVDELVIFDIEASKLNKPIDFELLENIASEAFMPIAYGGGIKTLEDVQKLFSLGIEKIVLNTSAIEKFDLVKKLVSLYGSQSIVFCLDIKKSFFGKYIAYSYSGSKKVKIFPVELAKKMQNLGIGELIINSIDNDGMMKGYDLEIIEKITTQLVIPVIACGGAGNLEDFVKAKSSGAHGCAAGSMFVYNGIHKAVLISYPKYEKLCQLFKEN